jgi:AcrR family transcriptional regulator
LAETPRTPTRRRLTAGERRARILAAAVEVFGEHGYERAGMGEIATRAGIVPSVIYDHFGSKRALHVELLERHGQVLIERSIDRLEADGPRELLEASVSAFFHFVEEDPFVWRFLFRDPPADAEIAAVHRRIHERATAGLAALVASGAPDLRMVLGVPRERADWMLARAAQGATNALAAWWYEHPEVPRREVAALATGLLWEGFARLSAEPPQP